VLLDSGGVRAKSSVAASFGAIGIAIAASLLLVTSPVLAIVVAPLSFGLMDWGLATALRVPGPSFVLRMFGRIVAAAGAGIGLRVLLSLAGTPRAPALAPWLLPAIAILFALTWSFAAIAGNLVGVVRLEPDEKPRPPLGEGGLVMLADVIVASFAVMLSIVAHDRPPRVAIVACLALAATMCARGLLVASIASRLATRPSSPTRVVLAFVLWLAHAGIVTTLAKDAIAWMRSPGPVSAPRCSSRSRPSSPRAGDLRPARSRRSDARRSRGACRRRCRCCS
jgi:hypothetical protein